VKWTVRSLSVRETNIKDDEAWEAVEELIASDPERAWNVIRRAIIECAAGDEFIIGAGPLEELLIKYPLRFASRTASEILHNEKFERAFTTIRFSMEYASAEDAAYFNSILKKRGVRAQIIPSW